MSFTVRAVLRTDKKNKEDLCPISIIVTAKGKRQYHSTGIRVPEAWWDADNRIIRKGFEGATTKNLRISNRIAELNKKLLAAEDEGLDLTPRNVRPITSTEADDFCKYAADLISKYKNPGTKRRREYNLKSLQAFAGENLSFADITPVFLTKFCDHLRDVEDNSNNTLISPLTMIRGVFNHARERGVTHLYPFKDWKMPKYEQPDTIYLTLEEVDKIDALLDEDYPAYLKNVAAHFLLECYSGIRFSDWSVFQTERLIDREHFYLSTTKTGARISLPLKEYPRLARIVDYIRSNGLVWKGDNKLANNQLKSVAIAAKIKKHLTTHTARHTCGTMLLEHGFTEEEVGQILGVSRKIVSIYAKVTGKKILNAFKRVGHF